MILALPTLVAIGPVVSGAETLVDCSLPLLNQVPRLP